MSLTLKRLRRKICLLSAAGVFVFILSVTATYLHNLRTEFDIPTRAPQPPLSIQPSLFPCLDSFNSQRHAKRVAVMKGPDWRLESSVEPKCLPEREVILSFEEGRGFLPSPATVRIRFWILNKQDKVYVRILESGGSEASEDSALDIVTNHKCKTQRARNCYVVSSRIPVAM